MSYFCSWESSAYGQESQGYDQYNQYGAADQTQNAYGQSAYGYFLPVHHLLSWPRVPSPFFSPFFPFLLPRLRTQLPLFRVLHCKIYSTAGI